MATDQALSGMHPRVSRHLDFILMFKRILLLAERTAVGRSAVGLGQRSVKW